MCVSYEFHVPRRCGFDLAISVSRTLGIHRLPAVEPPTDHAGSMEFISHVVELHAAHVRAAVSSLVCPVAALVLDLFCTPLVDVARELATPAYV